MKNIGTKKALGIVTCNREDFLNQIMDSIPRDEFDEVFIVDASGKNTINNKDYTDISTDEPLVVGEAKNRLLDSMIESGYDHLFLQEDDVTIKQSGVSDLYIETAKASGLWGGLNFAWHGNGNKDELGTHIVKNSVDLDDGVGLNFTHNGTAAFSYFHKNIIEKMGKFPEPPDYINALEHLAHYQKLSSYKLTSFMYWFPDAERSEDYIEDLDDGKHGGSVIRKDEVWMSNFHKANQSFKDQFGFFIQDLPRATSEQVLERLEYLIDNYTE